MSKVVTIELENLENKIKVLDEDIQKVNDRIVELERDKVKTISDNECTTRCQVTMCYFYKRIT